MALTALKSVSRSFRSRNYRLFFTGQSISLIGTWLTRAATSWLVYRLTGSAWLLGLVGFAGQLPTFFAAPFAGVWVDRWNRHRVLLATQVLSMIQSALLAYFAFAGTIGIPHLIWLSVFQGLVNAFDTPARQALVIDLVESREDLPNAVALNSSMVNVARLLGPSIAGVLIAVTGESWCFAIDAASYLAVIVSLLLMHLAPRVHAPRSTHILGEMAEGFRYASAFRPIRAILLLLAFVAVMGVPYGVLMPVIAKQVFHGGPHTYGFLMSSIGVGALAGALYLAGRRSVLGLGAVVVWSAIGFGVSLVAFAASSWLILSVPLLVISGAAMMTQMAACNTILQTVVDEDKRGRVMSLYTMAFFGAVPVGSLVAGALAGPLGARPTIAIGGFFCIVAGALFARGLDANRALVRPIYQRLGILPEIAAGISAADDLPEI